MYRKYKGEYMNVCLQQGASYAPVLGYRSPDDQIVSKLALRTLIRMHTNLWDPGITERRFRRFSEFRRILDSEISADSAEISARI